VLDPGPEIAKQQVVALDLTGLDGQVVRIRLESAPSFWMVDQVAISYDPEPTLTVHELSPRAAQTAAGKDVLSLLKTADGKAWSFEPGEQADLHFPVPPAKAGMDRSYLVRTTGWYTIHVPTGAAGDYAQLQRLIREPGALARFSTATLNEALRTASAPR